MTSFTRSIGRYILLALLALTALFPPGPSAPRALAQEQPTATPQASSTIFLPSIMGGGAAPDLSFAPAELALAPGEAAGVIVRVNPIADLRGASFRLDGAPDSLTSTFTAAADGASGTLTVAASDAAAEREQSLTVKGANGANTWVGSLKLTVSSKSAKAFFVDPVKGKDSNAGSQAKPFKTLAKALSKAKKGDTVQLAQGVYSKATNGEQFTDATHQVLVPSGVTIIGTLNGGSSGEIVSIFQGTDSAIGLKFQGDATVKNILLTGFDVAAFASKGRQSLSKLLLRQGRIGLAVIDSAQTTLTSSGIEVGSLILGVDIEGQAQFTMEGGQMFAGPNCEIGRTGLHLFESGRTTLHNVDIENIPGSALRMSDSSRAILQASNISTTLPSGCTPAPSVRLGESASLTLQNTQVTNSGGKDTIGISTSSDTPLTLIGSTISGFTGSDGSAGIRLNSNNAKLIVRGGSRIRANAIGITSFSTKLNVDTTIIDSEVSGNNVGIFSTFTLKVRNSRVIGNQVGIIVLGAFADLGQIGDPGGNTITGNTTTGVTFNRPNGVGGIFATGNTWNAFTQGADSGGRYSGAPIVSGLNPNAHGTNFDMPNGNLFIQL